VDYKKRESDTLNDGLFYEDCQSAVDNWDDDWLFCPVCLSPMYKEIDEDGNEKMILEHAPSMARFHQ